MTTTESDAGAAHSAIGPTPSDPQLLAMPASAAGFSTTLPWAAD